MTRTATVDRSLDRSSTVRGGLQRLAASEECVRKRERGRWTARWVIREVDGSYSETVAVILFPPAEISASIVKLYSPAAKNRQDQIPAKILSRNLAGI